jgi:aminopeptidase N
VKVQHFIVNSTTYFNSVKQGLDNTTQFIEKFSQLFGLYPFYKEKYGHMQASIGGGMEHQTMSTMASFGNNLIVHELAHQWFGNSTTCATWNHIWINEGFATYSEYLAQEQLPALYSAGAAASYMNSIHNSVMSSTGGSVHVPNASVYDENRIFSSRLSYNKGAAICHTLRFEMQNDNLYFQGLRTFLTRYKDSTATADQLKAVMEETAGRSLNDFFNQWYYGEGYPTYNVDYTKQGNNLVLTVTHTGSSAVTPLFKGLLEMRVQSAQGDTTLKLNITANNQQFTIPYTKTPSGVVVDPNNWIVNKVGLITTPVNNITEDATLKIFPNPASDIAYLSFKAGRYQQLQVFSAAGQLLAQRSIGNNLTQLTLPLAYAPGLYFIKLTGKENATVRKVEVR